MPDFSDKAKWELAATQLYSATLKGANTGVQAFPEMVLDELVVEWAAVPVFKADGTAFADTKEPGTTPFKTRATFKRRTDPTL